ncbi:MAG: metal-sulfur cluster assembly factor [bacterium]|nr:metal-sulfur cluster assembly factor [bacterium]
MHTPNTITEKAIIEKLKQVKDPELGIDIWTLGLVYKIMIDDKEIKILMTLTTPFCPFADDIFRDVKKNVGELMKEKDVENVKVDFTFEPPWEPAEELRTLLGL